MWNRIILPDTSSLTLDYLAGADPAGYTGREDDVDWHWDRIIAGAPMTTLLCVGVELAASENRQDGDRIIIVGRDSLQDTLKASVPEHAAELFQGLVNLNPRKVEKLLNASGAVQTNRLYLFLADYYAHAWAKRIDKTSIDLGSGKSAENSPAG